MSAYLRDHPPARSQFRKRRGKPSGVVAAHTAENTPDYVAFDGGAENVASWITRRSDPGSYHLLADSDSRIRLVDWDDAAFHDGTGTNDHSVGISVATRADVWPLAPQRWRDGAIRQLAAGAADYARWLKRTHGITVPARRITAAQARARVPGFVTHAELDPARRSDPGKAFPWDQFFREYQAALSGTATSAAPKEWSDMATREEIGDEVTERLKAFLPAAMAYQATGGSNTLVNPGLAEWGWVRDPRAVTLRELADGTYYYGSSAEATSTDVYVILGSHVGKLRLEGALLDWVKGLSALAGRPVKVEKVPDAVLAGIPDLGPAAPPEPPAQG